MPSTGGELPVHCGSRRSSPHRRESLNVARIDQGSPSLPGSFVTPDAMATRGWDSVPVGWLLETDQPLPEQITGARKIAAGAGLLIETREDQLSLLDIRWQATGLGALVALSVLAMTVGLIRGAVGRDVRTLTVVDSSQE